MIMGKYLEQKMREFSEQLKSYKNLVSGYLLHIHNRIYDSRTLALRRTRVDCIFRLSPHKVCLRMPLCLSNNNKQYPTRTTVSLIANCAHCFAVAPVFSRIKFFVNFCDLIYNFKLLNQIMRNYRKYNPFIRELNRSHISTQKCAPASRNIICQEKKKKVEYICDQREPNSSKVSSEQNYGYQIYEICHDFYSKKCNVVGDDQLNILGCINGTWDTNNCGLIQVLINP
ncbi:hypothetical protein AGLY_002313 [Aphis glycines]|uniref:Uncharacterized protein n=1 Tax=Aphis glycines TaxID=307491 RepID=A0A6G0U3J8_APHGL|nr:hypothetical protein AGLY_002313 [Aphis glycines]